MLCYDCLSGRYFNIEPEQLSEALKLFKEQEVDKNDFTPLNFLYEILNSIDGCILPPVGFASNVGFSKGKFEFVIEDIMTGSGPCKFLNMSGSLCTLGTLLDGEGNAKFVVINLSCK